MISHNTAFTYRNKPVDTKQIGRELRVRYVLEGSVRRLGQPCPRQRPADRRRDRRAFWADRFDGDTSDLFALQDEITSQIAFALNIELTVAEAARPTEHPDALDYLFRGRVLFPRQPPSRRQFRAGDWSATSGRWRSTRSPPRYRPIWRGIGEPRRHVHDRYSRGRPCARGRPDRSSLGDITPQLLCALRERHRAARSKPMERSHSPTSRRRSRLIVARSAHYGGSAGANSTPDRWTRRSRSQSKPSASVPAIPRSVFDT